MTLGGASVGDYDLVQKALVSSGMELGFWRIAMRPGKPLMHGNLGAHARPGPARKSDLVDGLLDPVPAPAAARLAWRAGAGRGPSRPGRLAVDLPANGARQDYMRTSLEPRRRRNSFATPADGAGFLSGENDGARRRPRRPPAARGAGEGRRPVPRHRVSWARGVAPTAIEPNLGACAATASTDLSEISVRLMTKLGTRDPR